MKCGMLVLSSIISIDDNAHMEAEAFMVKFLHALPKRHTFHS